MVTRCVRTPSCSPRWSGKRSIELDLKSDAGRARLAELVAECDVLCESWRPGVAERLGLGADTLRAQRPELIYCSISGYGQHGPWRDMPGHDLNYQALAGAIAPRPGDVDPPAIPRLPAADLEAGTLAALLVCAAWAKRLTTGEGECIDVAMADVMAWWIGPRSGVAVDVGEDDAERPGGSPGYGVFATADGAFITLAPLNEPHLWHAIAEALELGDELAATTFGERIARVGEINARVCGHDRGNDARRRAHPAPPHRRACRARPHTRGGVDPRAVRRPPDARRRRWRGVTVAAGVARCAPPCRGQRPFRRSVTIPKAFGGSLKAHNAQPNAWHNERRAGNMRALGGERK